MGLIFRAMSRYPRAVATSIFIKLLATISELMLPYILEHIIDDVAPLGNLQAAVLWGLLMFGAALLCRQLNVSANRRAIFNAHRVSYDLRQELFRKTVNLSGSQFDSFGLPSLISRMTSDSYNVQTSVQQFQTLCVRAPMLLIGGVGVTLVMDASLAVILLRGELLTALLEQEQEVKVKTKLPKFSVQYGNSLCSSLQQLGMQDAFDRDSADFSKMAALPSGEKLFIEDILHRTVMEVNEHGTKAAAVTIAMMGEGAALETQEPKEVYLDRPFFYMIIDTSQGLPLFMGTLMTIE